MKFNKFYLFVAYVIFFSCSAQTKTSSKINTKVNSEYMASRKTFVGKLSPDEYKDIRGMIEKELKIENADNKTILINYYQYGNHCSELGLSKKNAAGVIDNCIEISANMSKKYNMIDFFVYSENVSNKEIIENKKNFILDSGFLSNNIFTLQENCRAFFILKPNGDFMKYYGSDYYSEVEKFLKKK